MFKRVHGIGDDHSGDEQQVISRKEKSDEKPRLGENDEHDQVKPPVGNDPLGVSKIFYEVDNLRHRMGFRSRSGHLNDCETSLATNGFQEDVFRKLVAVNLHSAPVPALLGFRLSGSC